MKRAGFAQDLVTVKACWARPRRIRRAISNSSAYTALTITVLVARLQGLELTLHVSVSVDSSLIPRLLCRSLYGSCRGGMRALRNISLNIN